MRCGFKFGSYLLMTLVVAGLVVPAAAHAADLADAKLGKSSEPGPATVEQLIEQLGAADFATREKAQAELHRFGLTAFDALHAAQYHDDIEIAMRARYLVRSMQVNWSLESDPIEVKRILKDYSEKDELERKARMEQLAQLEGGRGIEALTRLSRFEPNNGLSKLAALLVLKHDDRVEESMRQELATQIAAIVGSSERPASRWLSTYAKTLVAPGATLESWDELTREEELTFAQFPEKSSRPITRDLLRWQADLLRKMERTDQAVEVMRRSIALTEGTREQLLDTIGWLMEREAWAIVDEVAERFPGELASDPLLLYRVAESQMRRGDETTAEATAAQARQLLPLDADLHVESATWLYERGLANWGEAELKLVIEQGPPGGPNQLRASFILSEMLHDAERELEAAETLQVVVDTMEEDPQVLELVQEGRQPGSIRSRMHYFYSLHYAAAGDRKKQREHLQQAVEHDETDADALIAMHRFPEADAQWKVETKKLIDRATEHFQGQVDELQQALNNTQNEQARAYSAYFLATAANQYAWLVANTVGDYDKALRYSQKSLELRPQTAGFLDTLGRCYYAKRDLENAVKYQAQAVALEPHSLQIRRQLELFEEALAEAAADQQPQDGSTP